MSALLACSAMRTAAGPPGEGEAAGSRLEGIGRTAGMSRSEVEARVADLLHRANRYSPYGGQLAGGEVRYPDGDRVLVVVYEAGAPAPWVETPDGSIQHYPPMDESVLEYGIERRAAARDSGERE